MGRAVLGDDVAGKPVSIDVDRLVESRLLLQANSGGGKSWALRRLLEQTHGKVQHLVLDIEGEFHTLRESFDYVLAAKTGGDTLADVRSAPLLARRLLELGVSAILDLYELRAPDRVRFVRLFLEALIDAPRELWHPALVVVDEAHHFCPQNGSAESASAVIDLMTRGRKRGFCGVLATQRLSKLHKDAAAETNCKLIGRASLDVDLRRAAEELGLTSREDLARIRSLPAGRFFAFGPGLSQQVVELQVGGVQTTHPRAGRGTVPTPPAREKVQKVLAQLADLPKQADEELRNLTQAKSRVADLERQLRAKPAPAAPPAPKVERVEVPVLKDGQMKRVEALAAKAEAVVTAFGAAARELAVAAGKASTPRPAPAANGCHRPGGSGTPPAELCGQRRRGNGAAASGDVQIGKCERAILAVLAQHLDGCEVGKLTLLSGYRFSGGFRNSLSALRTAGLIEGDNGGVLRLTQAGHLAAADVPPLPAGTALVEHWRGHAAFGACERAVFDVLLATPNGMSGPDAARVANYEFSGGFRNALSNLRTAGVIVGKGNDWVRLNDELLAATGAEARP